jgi:hypothetical protein
MESGENFTPGPWVWKTSPISGSEYLGVDRNDSIRIIDDGSAGGEYLPVIESSHPNAHLIAAAPDMYAAASEVIAAWDFDEIGQIDEELINRLREALAKARGEHD